LQLVIEIHVLIIVFAVIDFNRYLSMLCRAMMERREVTGYQVLTPYHAEIHTLPTSPPLPAAVPALSTLYPVQQLHQAVEDANQAQIELLPTQSYLRHITVASLTFFCCPFCSIVALTFAGHTAY